jgi:hypothetical protein
MAQFETFNRGLLTLKSHPHVTIQKRGALSMNRSAFVALGSPDAVELLYDRQARVIGLRPVRPTADHAYQVRRSTRAHSGPWIISAMAFMHYYDVDITKTRRWSAQLDNDVLCVDLNQEPTIVETARRTG